jgi:hypothetical protein
MNSNKRKLTIVKIGNCNYKPSPLDLERWSSVFEGKFSRKEMLETYPHLKDFPLSVEITEVDESDRDILLVRVGDDNYKPTPEELEHWKEIFEEAAQDPDFKIFTHSSIDVKRYKLEKDSLILVE